VVKGYEQDIMAISDDDLIQRVLTGERYHYARLVDRYRDQAFSLAMRMLRNREDAEEAAQDAFVRAFKALGTFERKARFGTWLYKIVYNVCLTRIERKDDTEIRSFDDADELHGTGSPISDVSGFESKDLIEFIRTTIDTMPQKYSVILTLFYLQDLTHDEVCGITGLPLGTVKVHLHRARVLLRELIQKELHNG